MMNNEVSDVESVLNAVPSAVSRLGAEPLILFLQEIFARNERLGLISKRQPARVAARLVELSVGLWDFLEDTCELSVPPRGIRVVDIGSGAGFPGIIWKLLHAELEIVLVERKSSRADFLRRLALLLKLDHLDVLERDIYCVAKEQAYQGAFDVSVMLAVKPPEEMAGTIEALLKRSGVLGAVRRPKEEHVPETLGDALRLMSTVTTDEAMFLAYRKIP